MIRALYNMFIVIAFIIVGVTAYQYVNSSALKEYCQTNVVGKTFEQVNNFVNKENLYLHRAIKRESKEAIINNHASPFFRMACIAEFEDGVATASKYQSGD